MAPAPWLERVEESFPQTGLGDVRLRIVNLTAKQWTWLEPILRQILANIPSTGSGSAKSTSPSHPASPDKFGS